jgi:hypothetical protein
MLPWGGSGRGFDSPQSDQRKKQRERNVVNIAGLNKAEVLAALYNRAQPQGMGFLSFDPRPWTKEDAEAYIAANGGSLDFDYVKGRVVKCHLDEDELYTRLFNRDNGSGAAEEVIEALRASGETLTPKAELEQRRNTQYQAQKVATVSTESTTETNDGVFELRLGILPEAKEAASRYE